MGKEAYGIKQIGIALAFSVWLASVLSLLFLGAKSPALSSEQLPPGSSYRFGVIGDYGVDNAKEAAVAAVVADWDPDFVITTGDNNYPDGEAATIDQNIGQYYSQFIGNYQGSYGQGSPSNRFWPSLGNHDWHTINCNPGGCSGAYFDYFTLPAMSGITM